MRSDFDGAEAHYRASVALDPGNAPAQNNLGFLLQDIRGDLEGAVVAYRAAIAADPKDSLYHNNLRTALLMMREKRRDEKRRS